MCSKMWTMDSTNDYWDKIAAIKEALLQADAVVIGAGAGLSASAGLDYGGQRFQTLFPDFIAKYGLTDMYSSGFYPFSTKEEFWAYFSRHIYHNRFASQVNDCYGNLLSLVQGKEYFVLTTNADHLFLKSGFDKERLFYTQGDYGLFQCSKPCHAETYDNREVILQMVEQQASCKIPTELLPECPKCGAPMEVNLRKDDTFVENEGWHRAAARYTNFLHTYGMGNILFLELGVGYNTPTIIKYPFWQMTYQNRKACYICLNLTDIRCPKELIEQSLGIAGDIQKIIHDVGL